MRLVLATMMIAAIFPISANAFWNFQLQDEGHWSGFCGSLLAPPKVLMNDCTRSLQMVLSQGRLLPKDQTVELLYRLGVAYRRAGDIETANKYFNTAILALDETLAAEPDAHHYGQRCWIKAIQNSDGTGAIADCSKALELKPDDKNARSFLGFAFYQGGNLQKTTEYLIEPRTADAFYVRSLAKRKLGDISGANADMEDATRLNSHIEEIYTGYGVSK